MAHMSPSLQRGGEESSCHAKARRPKTSVRSGCGTSAVWPGSQLKYVSTDLMFSLQSCLGRVGINIYIQSSGDDGEQVSPSPGDILDPRPMGFWSCKRVLLAPLLTDENAGLEMGSLYVKWSFHFPECHCVLQQIQKMKADRMWRRFGLRRLRAVCFWRGGVLLRRPLRDI